MFHSVSELKRSANAKIGVEACCIRVNPDAAVMAVTDDAGNRA